MIRTLRAFLLVGSLFAGGLAAGAATSLSAWSKGRNPYEGLDTLARAMTTIEHRYVEPTEIEDLVHSAVRGMADGLDRHTVYLDPDAWEALRAHTEDRYLGIGIEVQVGDALTITRVVPGGPAARGAMREGDHLVAIDGVEVGRDTMERLDALLEGRRGDPLTVTVERGADRLDLHLVRDQVVARSTHGELLAPGYAYVRIEGFRTRTGTDLREELARLAEEGGDLKGVVLDLRDNPGGLMDQAVSVSDLFLHDGLIVETRRRTGEPPEQDLATDSEDDLDTAVVVLINSGSASASEVVAGALQDRERAVIVGERSYGKGSVQQVFEFEDGSALKLTVARYHLPGGETIFDGQGVVPDIEVALPSSRRDAAGRLRAALATLVADDAQRSRLLADLELLQSESGDSEPEVPWHGTLAERLSVDPQLEAAWKTVREAR